jgi:hypothetical protein
MTRGGLLFLALATALALADSLEDTFYIPLDHPAIQYSEAVHDPVSKVNGRSLQFASNGLGYLPSLLKALNINADSQVLVFSKSSIQVEHISPRTPRAIYFNDEVSVGYVQNGDVLELTALDPQRGVILYSLDNTKSDDPELTRRTDCLRCHQGAPTLGIPGILVSSIHPRSESMRDMHGSSFLTDGRVPLSSRWGGWYVTGKHGSQTHLGNNIALVSPTQPGGPAGPESQNVTTLDDYFNTARYLVPTSDIVALMTLEHQTRMTNLLVRIGWDARIAQHASKLDEAGRKQLDEEIEQLVTYMLFTDEAPLKEPVIGVSTFTKTFPERGPRDQKGRSLRDFDLKKRLFRYPLSYMIYTAAFDALPEPVLARVYQRLFDVLAGKDQTEAFAKLSGDDRRAVLEIVRDTKKNLPAYWKN